MATYPAIERQEIIKEYINGIFRTKKQIIKRLEDSEISIVYKTLERDLKFLKDQGYEIEYVRGRGYILKHSEDFESELLNRISRKTKLNKFLDEETALSDFVLDSSVQMEGIDLIPEIFKGLQEKKFIRFDYEKFNSETSLRTVIPLWLKEDNERWYVIALPKGELQIKTFGLDRIKHLELLNVYDESLITSDIIEQVDDFKYRLGVSYPTFGEHKREVIQLAVSKFLLPYWKSKPVHPSQRITTETIDGYTVVTFVLIPNIDLIKLIVSGLGDIKLIEPKNLKKFIKKKYNGLMKDIF